MNLTWGGQISKTTGGAAIPRGVLNSLVNLAWGCQISGDSEFPVTTDPPALAPGPDGHDPPKMRIPRGAGKGVGGEDVAEEGQMSISTFVTFTRLPLAS